MCEASWKPDCENMSCCAKTVAINDAKRLGLRDNRKIAADVLRVSGIAGISRESGEIKAGAGGRPPSPDLRSSPPDLRPPRKLPKLPKLTKLPKLLQLPKLPKLPKLSKLPKLPKPDFEISGFLMQYRVPEIAKNCNFKGPPPFDFVTYPGKSRQI